VEVLLRLEPQWLSPGSPGNFAPLGKIAAGGTATRCRTFISSQTDPSACDRGRVEADQGRR